MIDAWLLRYARGVTKLVAFLSRSARAGVVPRQAKARATRLLSIGQSFARRYHQNFTAEQRLLLSMQVDTTIHVIENIKQFPVDQRDIAQR